MAYFNKISKWQNYVSCMKTHSNKKLVICICTHECDMYHKYHNHQQKIKIYLGELLDKFTQIVWSSANETNQQKNIFGLN